MGNVADVPARPLAHARSTTTTETVPVPPPAVDVDPLGVVQALYAAFGQGDMAGMLATIADDVDWSTAVEAPGAERVSMFQNGRGHDAVRHYFADVADLDFDRFVPTAFHVDGHRVLVELQLGFTHQGTGKRFEGEEIHRFEVSPEGKIERYRHFNDTAAFIAVFTPA